MASVRTTVDGHFFNNGVAIFTGDTYFLERDGTPKGGDVFVYVAESERHIAK